MSSEEAIAAWRRAEAESYRIRLPSLAPHDLLAFVELTHPAFQAGRVHELLCRKLEAFAEAVEAKKSPRLIVCMPPRAGKTTIATQRFPVWMMGRNPGLEVICAGYSADLAEDSSLKARTVARSEEAKAVFPGLRPRIGRGKVHIGQGQEETDKLKAWSTSGGSWYRAMGRGGSINGRGAGLLVLDDMLKDDTEADSPAIREGLWDWYGSTAYTRLAPGGGILVVTTRWHEKDLVGKLLDAETKGGDAWEVLNIPAIANNDEAWRKKGESYDPVRWPVEALERIKKALLLVNPRWWWALYCCAPRPEEGSKFKRSMFRRYAGDPREVSRSAREIIMSVDCANEEGKDACWSVIHVFGLFSTPDGDRLRLLDEERGQWELPDLLAGYDRMCRRWPRAVKRLVEYAANGIALCQLRSGTIRVNPKGDKDYPGGSKEQRAEYTLTALQSGLGPEVPEDQWAPWADAFIEEHVSFPTGDNKDRVDTTSQVCIRVLVKTPLSEVWGQIADEALRGKRSAA